MLRPSCLLLATISVCMISIAFSGIRGGEQGHLAHASDDSWPTFVAPKGCRFKWRGSRGYTEIAHSLGAARFPVIHFSREDFGPARLDFVPFCGKLCESDDGRAALRSLFPLAVGNMADFHSGQGKVEMRVVSKDAMPALEGARAFRVETDIDGRRSITSWWSPSVGWIVMARTGRLFKEVHEVTCSKSQV